jgi:signal transduction histidine kinase
VLNYAKLETGMVHFEISEITICDALAAAHALVEPQAQAKRLRLRTSECDPSIRTRADAEKLRQILANLLSNAVKFTDPGGSVELSGRAEDGAVVIRVRDTGVGIPAEKLGTIFDPFVQVRSDLTRPHEGTGLGLAISRDLALGNERQSHRGEHARRRQRLRPHAAGGVGSRLPRALP